MKVVIFGTGKFYQNRKKYYQQFEIQAFFDNDVNKQGMILDNVEIASPERWQNYDFDYVLLVSIHRTAMRKQLETLGISENKILDFTQIGKLNGFNSHSDFSYKAIGALGESGKNKHILLLTHELSYTGAPLVLLQLASVLRKHGFSPIVLSPIDGDLKSDFERNKIPVIVEDDISGYNHLLFEWLHNFSYIWVNTLYFSYLIRDLSKAGIPVIWWIHEAKNTYPTMYTADENGYTGENINVYADGSIAMSAVKTYMPMVNAEILVYGVPDFSANIDILSRKKVVFAVIGTIAYGKGQDIFVDAVEKLTQEQHEEAEFWIIGDIAEESFYKQFSGIIDKSPYIIQKKPMPHDELKHLYSQLDVVVCSSREDPMPVVLTEGMMNRKVCITSDGTGTACLITHKQNGFVYKSGDSGDLAEQMAWILEHKSKMTSIGAAARTLYENVFQEERFEENVLSILRKNFKTRLEKHGNG